MSISTHSLHNFPPIFLNTFQVRAPPGKEEENAPPVFDAEHEAKRKEQLLKLYNRTPEQVIFKSII